MRFMEAVSDLLSRYATDSTDKAKQLKLWRVAAVEFVRAADARDKTGRTPPVYPDKQLDAYVKLAYTSHPFLIDMYFREVGDLCCMFVWVCAYT